MTQNKQLSRRGLKELSQQELAVLAAVQDAVVYAALEPVYISFIRRLALSREEMKDGFATRRARVTFGFLPFSAHEGGIADAEVVIRRFLVSDPKELASHYLLWAPWNVTVTIRKGAGQYLLHAWSGHRSQAFKGGGKYPWFACTRYA